MIKHNNGTFTGTLKELNDKNGNFTIYEEVIEDGRLIVKLVQKDGMITGNIKDLEDLVWEITPSLNDLDGVEACPLCGSDAYYHTKDIPVQKDGMITGLIKDLEESGFTIEGNLNDMEVSNYKFSCEVCGKEGYDRNTKRVICHNCLSKIVPTPGELPKYNVYGEKAEFYFNLK